MSFYTTIIVLAVVGAMIGWITNILAIKLLFRPIKPINILGIKIQGLIPKRKYEIAKNIGEIVENELLSMDDIVENVLTPETVGQVKDTLKVRIKQVINEKVPSIIIAPFKDKISIYVDNMIDQEGDSIIEELIDRVNDKDKGGIQLAKIVEEKVNSFELQKIEDIIISVAKQELKHIEVLGGVLGFLIGIVQGVIVLSI